VSRILQSVGIAGLTAIVARIGAQHVAAFAIAARLSDYIAMGANATGAGIVIVSSASRGAGNLARARQTNASGILLSLGWGLLWSLVLASLAVLIGEVFTSDPQTVALLAAYLRTGAGGLAFVCGIMAAAACFNADQRALEALWLNIVGVFVLVIPLVQVCATAYGWSGFGVAATCGQGLAFVLHLVFMRRRALLPLAPDAAPKSLSALAGR
jgi:Na+-driven multidrug efflux pump